MSRILLRSAAVGLTMLLAAGCGSAGQSGNDSATTSTGDSGFDVQTYCTAAQGYDAATSNVDATSAAAEIAGFARAASAARSMADAAPPSVRFVHERLASAAEELVAGIRRRAPRTQHELETVGRAVTTALEAKYGNLDPETKAVKAFATKTCGLALG